jgi:5-oxoprolinase (ATP-hydrolysing)
MALADVVYETQEPCFKPLNAEAMDNYLKDRIDKLVEKSKAYLKTEGFSTAHIQTEIFLNIRYQGTDTGIMCKTQSDMRDAISYLGFENSFLEK